MSDPSGDDELRVAKRLLEAELSARGVSGVELNDGRVRELWAASGREFRLLVDVVHALGAPGDPFLPSKLGEPPEASDGAPLDGDAVRRLVLANLAGLGAALPEPETPPAGLDRLLPRLDEVIARAQARLGGAEG